MVQNTDHCHCVHCSIEAVCISAADRGQFEPRQTGMLPLPLTLIMIDGDVEEALIVFMANGM